MPTWEEIKHLAQSLEFRVRSEDADGVTISKFQGNIGWFQDSEAGRIEAQKWLEQTRATWAEIEQWKREHE